MITLVIVDCQNDFITGTMTVKGAKNVVEEIKKFIKSNKNEIEKIIFTLDWHPYNHCSFKKYGGQYPSHCVQHTPGACIEPKLLKFVQSLELNFEFDLKGELREVDPLGAFSDIDVSSDDFPKPKYYFDSIATASSDSDFVVCGISGDGCVKDTVQNMLDGGIIPKLLINGIISSDGDKILNNFIKLNSLEKI